MDLTIFPNNADTTKPDQNIQHTPDNQFFTDNNPNHNQIIYTDVQIICTDVHNQPYIPDTNKPDQNIQQQPHTLDTNEPDQNIQPHIPDTNELDQNIQQQPYISDTNEPDQNIQQQPYISDTNKPDQNIQPHIPDTNEPDQNIQQQPHIPDTNKPYPNFTDQNIEQQPHFPVNLYKVFVYEVGFFGGVASHTGFYLECNNRKIAFDYSPNGTSSVQSDLKDEKMRSFSRHQQVGKFNHHLPINDLANFLCTYHIGNYSLLNLNCRIHVCQMMNYISSFTGSSISKILVWDIIKSAINSNKLKAQSLLNLGMMISTKLVRLASVGNTITLEITLSQMDKYASTLFFKEEYPPNVKKDLEEVSQMLKNLRK